MIDLVSLLRRSLDKKGKAANDEDEAPAERPNAPRPASPPRGCPVRKRPSANALKRSRPTCCRANGAEIC